MIPSLAADIRISELGIVVRAEIQFCLCAFENLSVGLVLFIAQRQTDPSSLPVANVYWFRPVTQSVISFLCFSYVLNSVSGSIWKGLLLVNCLVMDIIICLDRSRFLQI